MLCVMEWLSSYLSECNSVGLNGERVRERETDYGRKRGTEAKREEEMKSPCGFPPGALVSTYLLVTYHC